MGQHNWFTSLLTLWKALEFVIEQLHSHWTMGEYVQQFCVDHSEVLNDILKHNCAMHTCIANSIATVAKCVHAAVAMLPAVT